MNKAALDPTKMSRREGISRRTLLQGLAGGLGAGMFASRAAAAPQAAPLTKLEDNGSPEVMWSTWMNVAAEAGYSSIYYQGIAAVCYTVGPGQIYTVDIHSGLLNSTQPPFNGAQFGNLVGNNGLIASAGNDGALWVLNPYQVNDENGAARLALDDAPVSNLLPWNGMILYFGASGNLVACTVTDASNNLSVQILWSVPSGAKNTDKAQLLPGSNGSLLVVTFTDIISMSVSTQTASRNWGVTNNAGNAVGSAACDAQYIYIPAVLPGSIVAFSTADGSLQWTYAGSLGQSPLTAYNGSVYFGDGNGDLNAVNANTGTLAWKTTLGGSLVQQPIFVEDGVAYASDSAGGHIYAVALDNPGEHVTFSTVSPFTQIVGIENGLCIALYGVSAADQEPSFYVCGIDLATQINGFVAESVLMADDYLPGGQPNAPVYRTHIQLLDPNKNPRAYKSVKVWSSEPTTISSGNVTYSVDDTGNNVAWLTTDGTGAVDITSPGDDVSAPALYLWGSFMDRQESIVLYPDYLTSQKLQTTNAAALAAATTYASTPMLPSGVNPQQMATLITSTLGGNIQSNLTLSALQSTSGARARHAATQILARRAKGRKRLLTTLPATMYQAYPDGTSYLTYQQATGPTTRNFSGAGVQNLTAVITAPTPQSQGTMQVLPWSKPPASPPTTTVGLLGDWRADFKKDITLGTNSITNFTITLANDGKSAWHYIETKLNNTYNFIVETFEDAVLVLGGIFKSILGDIEEAVQWLSEIFNWGAIKAYKTQIENTVTQFLSEGLQTFAQSLQKSVGTINAVFTKAENDVQTALTTCQGWLGSSTPQTTQQQYTNNNNPKMVFTGGSYAQSSMLTSKLKDNISGASLLSSSLLTDPPDAGGLWQKLSAAITADAAQFLPQLGASLKNFTSAFSGFTTDPTKFVEQSFTDILDIFVTTVADLATLALQVINAIVQTVIDNLEDLVNLASQLINNQIHIPVLSDMWNAIFGGGMSFLDLCAWIIAVPTAIIAGAPSSTSSKEKLGKYSTLDVIYTVGVIIGSLVDAAADDTDASPDSAVCLVDIAFGFVEWLHGVPTSSEGGEDAALEAVFFLLGAFPTIYSSMGAWLALSDQPEVENYKSSSSECIAAYGIMNVAVSVLFAVYDPTTFCGTNNLILAENLMGAITYVDKYFNSGGPVAKQFVALSDVTLPTTSAILSLATA